MAYAYILSPGKEKDTALQNVKLQFKECTELLCTLENTLESLMGTLLFEMKGEFHIIILIHYILYYSV